MRGSARLQSLRAPQAGQRLGGVIGRFRLSSQDPGYIRCGGHDTALGRVALQMYQSMYQSHQILFLLSDITSISESYLSPPSVAGVCFPRSRRPPCIVDYSLLLCSAYPLVRACPIPGAAAVIIEPRCIARPRRSITTAGGHPINIDEGTTRRPCAITRHRATTSRRRGITRQGRGPAIAFTLRNTARTIGGTVEVAAATVEGASEAVADIVADIGER